MSRLIRYRGSQEHGLTADSIFGSATWDAAVATCRAQLGAVRPRSRYGSLSGPQGHAALMRSLGLSPKKSRMGIWQVLVRLLATHKDRGPLSSRLPQSSLQQAKHV